MGAPTFVINTVINYLELIQRNLKTIPINIIKIKTLIRDLALTLLKYFYTTEVKNILFYTNTHRISLWRLIYGVWQVDYSIINKKK